MTLIQNGFLLVGGWAVITCPCGVIYSIKCNLRAESPRDFADLLLSWQNFPNVCVYDYSRGLASHTNRRQPENPPFRPFEGRLADHTPENIKLAADRLLKVSLPWLKHPKATPDTDGHPLTGSSQHFALTDVFHEGNSKDERDTLRRIGLVPELAGRINSQAAEQLFSGMRKNNYFLNMLTPSGHIFLQRNILHVYNTERNQKAKDNYAKVVGGELLLHLDCNGRMMLGN